jgi:hypothetical protein
MSTVEEGCHQQTISKKKQQIDGEEKGGRSLSMIEGVSSRAIGCRAVRLIYGVSAAGQAPVGRAPHVHQEEGLFSTAGRGGGLGYAITRSPERDIAHTFASCVIGRFALRRRS